MDSLRDKIKKLDGLNNEECGQEVIDSALRIMEESLSILDNVEAIVNDAEKAIKNLNESVHIDLDDLESDIKAASHSLY